ncbi:GMP synthase [glutamine-hydrolyzing] subunit B [uncultured archaeon]|nr:GMP synthase [glutamine-hydrolyzing] subunit B [uncultured archaeon]HKJ96769.1 glutamine-hydrolyzing GMP synthase [Thermoplasmataceae archaeon]
MFDSSEFVKEAKDAISRTLGSSKGILACSGGQDSTLLAVLSNEAAGDSVLTVFIDTGLLRKGEKERVEEIFRGYRLNYMILDESDRFIGNLKGVADPEEKRKIIGRTFIDVFSDVADEFGAEYLLQGTIAPDWIESGGGVRDTIKSHHNVGGLPENMKLKLLEPLRDLYKDEIREVSEFLELPSNIQPFPGPGLSVRIIGEVTREKLDLLRGVTDIVETEIQKHYESEAEKPWQFFAVLLPVKTTGIHGDKRSYGLTVAIRSIDTSDAMSGTFTKMPWGLLERISTRITNEFGEINRVVYDVTNKPPGTIEWE